jgi:hypothetical protein
VMTMAAPGGDLFFYLCCHPVLFCTIIAATAHVGQFSAGMHRV